ncbi:trypsin-like peptidase domain-containing protein [Rhodobacteraceae bacterium LMO-12]|nr:trypsin-like peptidase domain-containing protein [Rhodobacteraceae bacterium LMO-JJ12]
MNRWAIKTLALVLLFQPVQAIADNSSLIRLNQRDALLGWEAVGRVAIGDDGYCTGVLIATDLVLTAAHCVVEPTTGTLRDAESLTFRAGWREGAAIAESRISRVVAHSNYVPAKGMSFENIRFDAALLRLEKPIPSATAAPFALHGPAKTGQRVSVVSYGRGRDSALSWQRVCGLLGRQSGIMAFNCDVTFGSSGAPVFVTDGRRARILTLVSSGGSRDGMTIAYGMELPEVVAQLKRDLRTLGPIRPAVTPVRRIRVGGSNSAASGAKFVKP